MPEGWIKIRMGRLSEEQAANIAREIRTLIDKLANVYPQGVRERRGQMKVTRDDSGYYFYLNHQALFCILLFCKDIPHPFKKTDEGECPPDVPSFLRWDQHAPSDSKPE